MWEKNPDTYFSGVANAIFVPMERPYASADTRLRAVVERGRHIPQAFTDARKNLRNPPRIYTEVALDQIDGLVSFFEKDVPSAFADAKHARTKAEFAQTNAAVIAALKSYGEWIPAAGNRQNGTSRGTSDAIYLYYTLGKLEILKLRADLQQKQGGALTLGGFHDAFMRQGPVPIKVVLRSLLGNDSPVL